MQHELPSIDSLRAFEAVARLSNFKLAGNELGMSQPAVTHQVQRLERQLQALLFERTGGGSRLTVKGVIFLEHAQQVLESLRTGVEAIRSRVPLTRLEVATDFSLASYWLVPRLPRFYAEYPQLDVHLVTNNRPISVLPTGMDVAIVFGDGQLPRGEARLLFQEEVFPVCSPSLLPKRLLRSPRELLRLPLLHANSVQGQRWFEWPSLLRALDLGEAPVPEGERFENTSLAIQAAIDGRGVAIGWRHLVDDLVERGLLRRLLKTSVQSRYGYHLILPQRQRRSRFTQPFVDWVIKELAVTPRASFAS